MASESSAIVSENSVEQPSTSDSDMDWIQVNKRKISTGSESSLDRNAPAGKKGKAAGSAAENAEVFVAYVKGREINITLTKPESFKKSVQEQVGAVQKIEKAGQSLRVFCQSSAQKGKLLGVKIIANIAVIVSEPRRVERSSAPAAENRYVKMTVSGVPTDISEDEMCEAANAMQAQRIMKRVDGVLQPTVTFILSFDNTVEIPESVAFDYLVFRTRPYVPQPMRCFRCQIFGHRASQCNRRTQACPVCTGDHTFELCPNKEKPKCVNCGGEHSSAYKLCEAYQNVRETLKVMVTGKMSYKDALQSRKETQVQTGTGMRAPIVNSRVTVMTQPAVVSSLVAANTQTPPAETPAAVAAKAVSPVSVARPTMCCIATQTEETASSNDEETVEEKGTQTAGVVGEPEIKTFSCGKIAEYVVKLVEYLNSKDSRKIHSKEATKLALNIFGLTAAELKRIA